MIRYRLVCAEDHLFDSWFESSAAFDKLQAAGLIECPQCGSHDIRKALMTPGIAKGLMNPSDLPEATQPNETAPPPAPAGALIANDPRLAELQAQAVDIARKIRDHIRDNADYVGDRFAEEARKIHFEEVEPHGIYGEATGEEVSDLVEDGIEIYALPRLPEDGN